MPGEKGDFNEMKYSENDDIDLEVQDNDESDPDNEMKYSENDDIEPDLEQQNNGLAESQRRTRKK